MVFVAIILGCCIGVLVGNFAPIIPYVFPSINFKFTSWNSFLSINTFDKFLTSIILLQNPLNLSLYINKIYKSNFT